MWGHNAVSPYEKEEKMFLGRYEHSINGSGRTSIPAKLREELHAAGEERLIITNLEDCLVAYPYSEWKKEVERFSKLPQASKEATGYRRFFVSGAQECPIDKQGRILIPPTLREHAGLSGDIIFVGQLNFIEIWARDKWEVEFEKDKGAFGGNKQRLAEQGL